MKPELHFKQEAPESFDLAAAQAALLSRDIDDAPELRQVHRQLIPDHSILEAHRIFKALTPRARQAAKP